MGQRQQFHNLLSSLSPSLHVYFQPPDSSKMNYPCIVYELNSMDTRYANNKPYSIHTSYSVTVIDKNPDSLFPKKVAEIPMSSFDRVFKSDNLYHYVFTIYY